MSDDNLQNQQYISVLECQGGFETCAECSSNGMSCLSCVEGYYWSDVMDICARKYGMVKRCLKFKEYNL